MSVNDLLTDLLRYIAVICTVKKNSMDKYTKNSNILYGNETSSILDFPISLTA